jgi:Flp pilus assembly protein TadB
VFSLLLSVILGVAALCCSGVTVALWVTITIERLCDPARLSSYRLQHLQTTLDRSQQRQMGWSRAVNALLRRAQRIGGHLKQMPVIRLLVRPLEAGLKRRQEEALRDRCLFDLPEMIDVLSLALGAGLSFDQAFEWYLSSFTTPLADEFRSAQQAYQVGMMSRIRAFEDVANRLQEESVLRFVATLRSAFTLGSPLAPAFDSLAFETRRYRKSRIEERIAKTPVKLLIPLGACIVPAVLILLMGPIMTQVIGGLNI